MQFPDCEASVKFQVPSLQLSTNLAPKLATVDDDGSQAFNCRGIWLPSLQIELGALQLSFLCYSAYFPTTAPSLKMSSSNPPVPQDRDLAGIEFSVADFCSNISVIRDNFYSLIVIFSETAFGIPRTRTDCLIEDNPRDQENQSIRCCPTRLNICIE